MLTRLTKNLLGIALLGLMTNLGHIPGFCKLTLNHSFSNYKRNKYYFQNKQKKQHTPNTNHVKKVNTTSTNELTPPQTTSYSIVHFHPTMGGTVKIHYSGN
jgi:hypothetical protein